MKAKKKDVRRDLLGDFHDKLKSKGSHIIIATQDSNDKVCISANGNVMELANLISHLASDNDLRMSFRLGLLQTIAKG